MSKEELSVLKHSLTLKHFDISITGPQKNLNYIKHERKNCIIYESQIEEQMFQNNNKIYNQ